MPNSLRGDANGFIIGNRRLKEMSESMDRTESHASDILDILKKSKRTPIDSGVTQKIVKKAIVESSVASDRAVKAVVETSKESVKTAVKQVLDAEKSKAQAFSAKETAKAVDRDVRGRFVSAGSMGGSASVESGIGKSITNGLKDALGDVRGVNARGVDPTVDAIAELKDVVAPVGGIFGRMSSRAISFFTGRRRKNKNEEVIPEEQSKANKEKIKLSFRLNKLVEKLIGATRRNAGDGGLSGFMGVFGKGKGKGLLGALMGGGKALLKKAPVIGALLSGGLLAKDWGKLDAGGKGKGIGQMTGMIAGGAVGALFGGVGAVGGGALGHYLGGIFGEKVGSWTDSLKRENFADIFRSAVSGIGGMVGSAGKAVIEKFSFGSDSNVKVSGSSKKRQLMMYDALRKAGFSENQALAIGGEIGRENDYSDKMFGTHIDPAKSKGGKDIVNSGVLSWNGKRGEAFREHMRSRGLMDAKGNMPHSQEALNAQADFIMKEMKSSNFKGTMSDFLKNENGDAKKSAVPLAKYIGWARGQSTIRGANGTRIPFDSKKHEGKINAYIDQGTKLVRDKYGNPVDKKQAETKQLKSPYKPSPFKNGVDRPSPIKVPAIKPELARVGRNNLVPVSSGKSDANINQSVSDRGIAHVLSGGLGFRD